MRLARLLGVGTLAAAAALAAPAAAQTNPGFVQLGRVSATIYRPDSGPAPHIAFLIAHRSANNLNNVACRELSKRGFLAFCFNTRFVNNDSIVNWEEIALDVKTAVNYVRTIPGVTKVVLLGHSGGSPLMSYYQAVAENGVSYCEGPNKIVQCGSELAGMKPADGLLFDEAHPGDGVQALRGINPSLSIVDGKVKVDPELDPFDPKNGYNPKGASHYAIGFRTKYYEAQSKVMNAQLAQALALRERIKKGESVYPDDDAILVPFSDQAGAARLDQMDPSIPEIMSTARPEKLLKNDGTIVHEVVKSVEPPHPKQAERNRTFDDGTKMLTLNAYLSANAVRSTNSMDGIDHCSNNNSTICAVQYIKVPTLIVAMGAYHMLRDEELMYDKSAATDKDYIVIEGAELNYNGCKPCETTPGQFANATKNNFDYIAKWANAHF
ncbi:MAG TPA: hypothetical protein VHT51_03905 [Micropepsaceae bacterium]|jgi:hypothetical protein|nr:hypothetical protein [Micropepsaceae bacterium]